MKIRALIYFLFSAGYLAAELPEPSFYAPFDNTTDAVHAVGGGKTLTSGGELTFLPGVKGKALRIGGELSPLAYASVGNADPCRGTVSFWYKPEWAPHERDKWRFLFSFSSVKEQPRIGSGSIRVWSYDGRPRADPSDPQDRFLTLSPFKPDIWHHVAYVWTETNVVFYVDGLRKDSVFNKRFGDSAAGFNIFFIGGKKDGYIADGLIDEFRLYTHPLNEAQISALRAEFQALSIESVKPYFFEEDQGPLSFSISNCSKRERKATWRVGEKSGTCVVPALGSVTISSGVKAVHKKKTEIRVVAPETKDAIKSLWSMRRDNPLASPSGSDLKLELLDTVTLTGSVPPADRFVTTGAQVFRVRNGLRYLEAGSCRGDRFAVRFRVPTNTPLCCFEFDYPDDADRIADIIVQPSKAGSAESAHHCEADCHDYQLQVGYVTGDAEYRPMNRMVTARCLYWAKQEDVSVVFSTLKDGFPAAVAAIRLYRVEGGLPDAGVRKAEMSDGGQRSLGLYYEDPAIAYDFAVAGSKMPDFEDLINRTAAYMKYSGQNLFVYPAVWYNGAIGPSYQPRSGTPHAERYLSGWFTKFDAEGLGFMPGINLYTIPEMKKADLIDGGATNGLWYATCRTAFDTGGFRVRGSHHMSPDANILHPDTQAAVLREIDAIIAEGKGHPSFRGIDVRLSQHCLLWLGDIHAGYNDYAIDGFTKDTGIAVPVDRHDPLRGKAYARWLLANAKEAWLDWRCRKVAAFHKQIAARLSELRPDLCFSLTLLPPVWRSGSAELFSDPSFNARFNREAGIDPTLYADTPNIIISQGSRPMQVRRAMPRAKDSPLGIDPFDSRGIFYTAGYYTALKEARRPWIHTHDYYWETSFGDPLREGKGVPLLHSDWFTEHHWRVTTMNPPGFYAMKQYVLPFRYSDILGITRGGFLIGTYGMESELIPFAKAFRALPAKRFIECPSSTGTVKYRILNENGRTWFYVVNTDDRQDKFAIVPERGKLIDLVTGSAPEELQEGKLNLTLAPYQFRSFVIFK